MKTPWWSWKLTTEDLNEQVTKYSELSIIKSCRGQVVIFFSFIFIISLVLSLFFPAIITPLDVILSFIVYAILMAFGYKGHRWALIALLILWTVDKLVLVLTVAPRSVFTSLLFWIAGAIAILRALHVAIQRKRRTSQSTQAA